ncbi:MAG: hypothetical protein NC218_08560 [Acetobacter sp.]|nr:hypothetical protein [Acetobacter sp.]
MRLFALKEVNTGLYYNENIKDIAELSVRTLFFKTKKEAYKYLNKTLNDYQVSVWFTTLSAIERMYDLPIFLVPLTPDLIQDTAGLFKFKVQRLTLLEGPYNE